MPKKKLTKRIIKPGQRVVQLKIKGAGDIALATSSDLSDAIIERCEFEWVSFANSNFSGATIIASTFEQCKMRGCVLDGMSATETRFYGDAIYSRMTKSKFSHCDVTHLDLDNVFAQDTVFADSVLTSASMECADMQRSVFTRCKLVAAQMSRSTLHAAQFTDCDMSDTLLRGADLTRAVFSGVILDSANIANARLDEADFSNIKMIGATLTNCFATDTIFDGAILAKAGLVDGFFHGASFANADLSGADLSGSDFRRANLSGAILRRAHYDRSTRWPDNFTPPDDTIDIDRHDEALQKAIDMQLYKPEQAVFLGAPDQSSLPDLLYALYPTFFTVIDRWAFMNPMAGALHNVIQHAMRAIRAGDGAMPYETDEEKMYCLVYHLHNALSAAQIAAFADAFGVNKVGGDRFKNDKHQLRIYAALQDEISAARRKAAKNTKSTAASQATS